MFTPTMFSRRRKSYYSEDFAKVPRSPWNFENSLAYCGLGRATITAPAGDRLLWVVIIIIIIIIITIMIIIVIIIIMIIIMIIIIITIVITVVITIAMVQISGVVGRPAAKPEPALVRTARLWAGPFDM